MAFALNAWSSSLAALSGLLRPLRKGPARAQPSGTLSSQETVTAPQPTLLCAASITVDAGEARGPAANEPLVPKLAVPRPSARPLRVKMRRLGDGDCRLVISGRMADVCAELDRLVLH